DMEQPPPPDDEMPKLCPRSQGPGSSDSSTVRRPKSSTSLTTRARKVGGPRSGVEPTAITPRSGTRGAVAKPPLVVNVPLWAGVGAGALLLVVLIALGAWWALRDRTPAVVVVPPGDTGRRVDTGKAPVPP